MPKKSLYALLDLFKVFKVAFLLLQTKCNFSKVEKRERTGIGVLEPRLNKIHDRFLYPLIKVFPWQRNCERSQKISLVFFRFTCPVLPWFSGGVNVLFFQRIIREQKATQKVRFLNTDCRISSL